MSFSNYQKYKVIGVITSLAILIVGGIWYFFLPTNVGVFWLFLIISNIALSIIVNSTKSGFFKFSFTTVRRARIGLFLTVLLTVSILGGMFVFRINDRAQYFDEKLTYTNELPFYQAITGEELRVVDRVLAQKIMDKSNVFGSNMAIKDIHLGNINGKTYWIGAASFDSIILSDDHNTIQGFLGVDFTDPTKEVIIIEQKFEAGYSLILNHDLQRIVHNHNYRYLASDNAYYSMNDAIGQMELIVPFHVKDHVLLGDENGGFITQDMWIDGGVLRINNKGDVVKEYGSSQRDEIPSHAQIQLYSETWLETNIEAWGKSIVNDHEISWSASALPWARSSRRMGIDDDVRVVVDPDTGGYTQYTLLDSTDSTNSILRGAIKANSSGLFYYNWEEFNYIDTNSAHDHVNQAVIDVLGTSTHGYKTLLPILYPIGTNVTSLDDYAYVVTLQLGDSRFGGIAITDPSDKTGTRTVVEFAISESVVDIAATMDKAISRFLALIQDGNTTIIDEISDFTISQKFSYVEEGDTIYVMEGLFGTANQTVVFSREYILTIVEWIQVVSSEIDDTLRITAQIIDGIIFATSIEV